MRKMILCGAICLSLSATVLMAGDNVIHLNVKTGLWEITSISIANGSLAIPPDVVAKLTPEQRAKFEAAMKMMANGTPKSMTYKSCLTQKKLDENPFNEKPHGEKINCQHAVVNSTETDLEVKETCTEENSKTDMHFKFHASSPEHVTGTGTVVVETSGGHTMTSNVKMESKWVGATCPADVK